jgi:hypothetical protein
VLYVKKINSGAKIDVVRDFFFVFLHRTQKMLVFRKTCHMHIECRDVRAKFLFEFF